MAKRGPKGKWQADKIDPIEVEKLAAMACTAEEMAAFFGCSQDTIEVNFPDALKRGRATGRMSMKRKLFEKVQKGDLGAMVWWGKNFAGMSDRVEKHITGSTEVKTITETPQEQLERIKSMVKEEQK